MRIVFLSFWYSEGMGYISNLLPKAFATLGHEVHVVTSTAQFYFDSPTYAQTYEPFVGPPIVESSVKPIDGYTLHRLPLVLWKQRIGMRGLYTTLQKLKPQIVQTVDVIHLSTYQAAIDALLLDFKLFTGCHMHASVFPPTTNYEQLGAANRLKLWLGLKFPGIVADKLIEKCYAIAPDTADVAVKFYGISPQKVEICPLGVDTELFQPAQATYASTEQISIRKKWEFADTDIICVYTGRFSEDKNPLCLAKAIDLLISEGLPFRGVFIGGGVQEEQIRACKGCLVQPFVPVKELAPYYRAADIGVWPQQESTSMLDAAASGLPIVVSDQVRTTERIDGNGLTYQEGDFHDLANVLKRLTNPSYRQQLGRIGAAKMVENFSWMAIAKRRVKDYEAALMKSNKLGARL